MGDHDRARPERIVEPADQLPDDAQRDRIEAGERLVVHDQHRVERNRARQRDTACHAARELRGLQRRRTPQADGIELHQHEVANQFGRQVGMFAQRERDVVEHRHVGEQRAELEQHPHAPAQRIELAGRQARQVLARDVHDPAAGPQLPADQAQQSRLATAAAAHDRHHLPARDVEIDAAQDDPLAVCEANVLQLHERGGGFG